MTVRGFLIGASIALNVVVGAGFAWLAVGGGGARIAKHLLAPRQAQLRSHFDAFPIEAGDVVFLGDSITEGGQWEELFPGVRTRDTSAGVLARVDQVTGRGDSGVFLLIGTNDLLAGIEEDEIAENVAKIVSRLRGRSPPPRVFVQSVLPRAAEYSARLESLNACLAAVAQREGAEFVDLYPAFVDPADRSIRDELSNDELHLLGSGYQVWRTRLAPLVAAAAAGVTVPAPVAPTSPASS